ncbi:MAG TPA: hypothetical protein VJ726_11205 [Candidatus Limnocylindria bacterium]|nr:hypothetical protein [Candidatus Limnocylindria bacterium]
MFARRLFRETLTAIVCVVGTTELRYHLSAIDDLHAMLKKHGDWMPLGSADEQKAAADGTVEAWGRSSKNPVKGWYGLKKGLRGRFGMYVPPLLAARSRSRVALRSRCVQQGFPLGASQRTIGCRPGGGVR